MEDLNFFDSVSDYSALGKLLSYEQPQTIALVIFNLKPEKASVIFDVLNKAKYSYMDDVVFALSNMRPVSMDIVEEVFRVILSKLKYSGNSKEFPLDNLRLILNELSEDERKRWFEILENQS